MTKFNYQLGDKVFVHTIKKAGYIDSINRDGQSVTVKVKNESNKKHERVEVKLKDISPYRPKKPKKYNPDEMYWMVRKFQETFGHPVADSPKFMENERAKERYGYMLEELNEFNEAETLEDQCDALIDLMYFIYGTFVEMGVRPFNLFKIVNEANMGKLWEDGKPRYREEDNKVIKPPYWKEKYAPEPRIKEEIERQKRK